MARPLGAISM